MIFTKRTIDDIFQSLKTEKETFASLTGLTTTVTDKADLLAAINSDSKVAIWRLIEYIESTGIWAMEENMEIFINDVELEKLTASVSTRLWYKEQMLAFQYGDILQIDPLTYRPYYTTIDTSKQIIGSCSAQETGGKLILKIRGRDTDILNASQLNALYSYVASIKAAGIRIQVRNSVADSLKLYLTIVYDPQRPISNIQTDVELVINTYIKNIEFDSTFKTNSLIDKLQSISGVLDAQWTTTDVDPTKNGLWVLNHPNSSYSQFIWSTMSYSGYYEIDGSFPLNSTITYQTTI